MVLLPKLGLIKITKGTQLNGFTLSFLLIFVFCALRFDVGYDYSMYYDLIDGNVKWYHDQINRIEFLSRQLIIFSNYINFFQFFFIFTSFVVLYFFYKVIRENSLDLELSTLLFIGFPIFFFMSLSVVRQYMVVAIMFYSFKYIKQRKFYTYLGIILLCSFIHKSSILALPIYFLYGNFINKKWIVFIYLFGFFSSDFLAFFIDLFSERYSKYLNGIGGEGGDILLVFFQVLGLLIMPLVFNFRDKKDENFNFYLLTFYVGLLIWSSLSKFGHAGIRGGLYYMSYLILLIPHLKKKIKEYKIIKEAFTLLCVLFFFINLYIGSKHRIKDPNLPYQTFFMKTKKDFKSNE